MLLNWQLHRSLQAYNPVITHFGQKIITACCKQYAKESISQQMEQDKDYMPHSAKATDFKITLSHGTKEDKERVSFLELRIQQVKAKYKSELKNVIEECISLEIQAAKKEETQLIMDLLPTIGTTIQKLQGIEGNEHLQTVNALKMAPTLLQYGPISTKNTFLAFFQTYHSLDDIPNPTIRTMEDEYPTVEERTKAMHFHTTLLQRSENSGIQTYVKCLESILTIPTTSYNKQVKENKQLLNLKKLSNEIIMGQATEDTVMELDGKGAADFEQPKDLIRKECDKRDRRYAHLEEKYKKLEHQVTNHDQQKNMAKRGQQPISDRPGASKKNKSDQKQAANQRSNRTSSVPTNNTGQNNRKNPVNPGQAVKNNNGTRPQKESKTTSPSQNKSNRRPCNGPGRKKPPRKQQ